MNFFKVKTLEEATKVVKDNLPQKVLSGDFVSLEKALNQIAYEDVFSLEELPPFNRSTVDGYAVCAQEVYCASESVPSILKVVGSVRMGEMPTQKLMRGEAIEIATGAVVPEGANAVVMIEHTERMNESIAIYQSAKVRENMLLRGEDIQEGEKVLSKGEKITALKLGVLAGVGVSKIKVYSHPKVAVISTGDELVGIDEIAQNGKIRDINSTIIPLLCQNSELEVVSISRVKDDKVQLFSAVKNAVELADMVLISGGSSVGARDFTEAVLSELGEILVHGIALKPGKPTMIAKIKNSLVIGLAGHPLAAALTYKVLIENSIFSVLGCDRKSICFATTSSNFPSTPGRTVIQPVSLLENENEILAEPVFLKSAHLAQLSKADGYIVLPDNCEGINKGEKVKVFAL
ncbi:MAG: molybdopterin molybdotransferase MoeA [Clostridia bacterium]|nr:molybdopterin molybdotransferase MoeA [Clostridia bacterium]